MSEPRVRPNCAVCVHRLNVPGSAHIRCNAGLTAKVVANAHGVKHGWCNWPINFDPIWLEECDSWSDDEADRTPRVEYDPWVEILSMLR